MNSKQHLTLVVHDESEWEWFGIHEALFYDDELCPYWVGSKAVRKFDNYHEALGAWTYMEKMSAYVDVLYYSEIQELMDRVDYSEEEEELNFD